MRDEEDGEVEEEERRVRLKKKDAETKRIRKRTTLHCGELAICLWYFFFSLFSLLLYLLTNSFIPTRMRLSRFVPHVAVRPLTQN